MHGQPHIRSLLYLPTVTISSYIELSHTKTWNSSSLTKTNCRCSVFTLSLFQHLLPLWSLVFQSVLGLALPFLWKQVETHPKLSFSTRNTCIPLPTAVTKRIQAFNLLAPELFFLILAHPVYKLWIIQEPKTLELWNKLHFEGKNGQYIPCLKYSIPIFVE